MTIFAKIVNAGNRTADRLLIKRRATKHDKETGDIREWIPIKNIGRGEILDLTKFLDCEIKFETQHFDNDEWAGEPNVLVIDLPKRKG